MRVVELTFAFRAEGAHQLVAVTARSGITGKEHTLDIPIKDEWTFLNSYKRWEAGELIQNAFPDLDAGQREFLMTGITPEEWDETFGEGEKADDEVSG